MAEFQIVDEEYPYEVCLLPKEKALTFCDYLNSVGISASARPGASAAWIVAVASESDVHKAKRELVSYADSPYAQKYVQASWNKGKELKGEKQLRAWSFGTLSWDPLSVTSVMEVICVLFFIGMYVDEAFFYNFFSLNHLQKLDAPYEYYRLITPTFMHFGIIHIAFNLVMWEALARPIERHCGSFKLLELFLETALISNVLQYGFMHGGDIFGGMSGVVYGVIGYMGVIATRADLPDGLSFPKGLLTVSVIFILFGFLLSGIANFCHVGGLLVGILRALLDYKAKIFKR